MKRDRHAIGLVNTPLQLICFNEWCICNKVKGGTALIRLTSIRSKLVIKEFVNSFPISCEVKYFNCYSKGLGLNYFLRTLIYLFLTIFMIVTSRNKIIIGEFQTSRVNMLLVKFFGTDKFILVDDGFATTSYQTSSNYPVIDLFTFYDYLKAKKGQSIEINTFNFLKSIGKNKKFISDAFIGTDMHTIKIMGGIDNYLSHIKYAYECSKENLYYFPKKHGHDFANLNSIIKDNFPNIKIIDDLLPIELYLLLEGICIGTTYSHISSAIVTLDYLSLCKNFKVIVNNKLSQEPSSLFILNQMKQNLKNVQIINEH